MNLTELWLGFLRDWQLYTALIFLIIAFALTSRIKALLKAAKKGFIDIFTVEGFIIFLGIIYLMYRIYLLVIK